jgi:HAE1 family hydrophobic/amphiphilic exporter-1
VALVFIPLCVYLTLPTRVASGTPSLWHKGHDGVVAVLRRGYEQSFGRLSRAYQGLLAFFLRRRLDLMLAIVVIFMLTVAIPIKGIGPFENMKVEMVEVQEEERWTFSIWVEMPPTSTLEETEEWFLAAEKVVEDIQEELDIDGYYHWHRRRHGEIEGWLKQPRTNEISPKEVNRRVKEALPRKPGVELFVSGDEEQGDSKGESFYTIPLNGEDPDTLDRVKEDLESFFARVEGVLGVKKGDDPPPNELGLVIDRDRAQRYDVNPEQVAGVVGAALMGMQLPKYYQDGKEIPVRVRFQESDRESLTELADFQVRTGQGEMLALGTLTDPQFLPTPQRIVRRNKRLGRVITLELEEGKEQETRQRVATLQAGIDLPEGISFGADFRRATFNEDLAKLNFALLLSVVFIYLLMGFLFESFVLPLSIISTIPLSIIGVYWAHLITGKDIDFLGVVAMVLLVGVVVNNGIVLIDYVNRLRNKGSSRRDALLDATGRRFRPIMMTAITTIGGLLPLALAGRSSIGLSYTSFSITLIGGMTTATLLTLLVVPVFYTFFDDAREACSAALRRALGQPAVETPTPS